MAEISAAAVKALREKTGLPMMECKRALAESNGDQDAAVEWLRKQGIKTQETRIGRETGEGRLAAFINASPPVGVLIELLCESAPVAASDEFLQLAADIAKQLATGPGATSPDALLAQPSPSKKGTTLAQQKDDLFNRIREVFNLKRIARINGACAQYVHHNGSSGVLLEYSGTNADLARDVAMHVAAMQPLVVAKEELDPAVVAKEREILAEAARKEGKPENIIDKMIDGRMRVFYSQTVLLEQPFVKDEKQTVGKVCQAGGIKPLRFVHWQLGKE